MEDRELLKLAAKAAKYLVRWYDDTLTYGPTFAIEVEPGNPCGFAPWNPLDDDGDALRLAVKLGICIQFIPECDTVQVYQENEYAEPRNVQVEALDDFGTRRAVVRAAAEIGRAMP